MTRRPVLLAAASCVAFVACFPDLSALSGGASDAGLADAARPENDSSSEDASAKDAAPSLDGGFRCQPGAALFCDDFEAGELLETWTFRQTQFGGKAEHSTGKAQSGSRSLFASLPRRGNLNTNYAASVSKRMPGAWRHVKVNLDVWLDPVSWQAGDINSGILAFAYNSDTQSHGIALSIDKDSTTLGVGQDSRPPGADFPEGKWVHLTLDADPESAVELRMDGVVIGQGTANGWAAGANPDMTLQLGVLGYNDPAPEYAVYYDNVVVELVP